jgi:hypothetical protein
LEESGTTTAPANAGQFEHLTRAAQNAAPLLPLYFATTVSCCCCCCCCSGGDDGKEVIDKANVAALLRSQTRAGAIKVLPMYRLQDESAATVLWEL